MRIIKDYKTKNSEETKENNNKTDTELTNHTIHLDDGPDTTSVQITNKNPEKEKGKSKGRKRENEDSNKILPLEKRGRSIIDDEGYNSEDEYTNTKMSTLFDKNMKFVPPVELGKKLKEKGLDIVEMAKDGNCLFHSVSDQIYGDPNMHDEVRKVCVNYMIKERDHYSQFVTEDFNEYIKRKSTNNTYGNHLELQAISELYNRPVLIYTVDENPLNIFQSTYKTDNPPIRLSYHGGNHYNSVRDPINPSFGVGLGLPGLEPGSADKELINRAKLESEQAALTDQIMEEAKRESELELIEKNIMEESTRESELEILQQVLELSALEQSMYDY